MNKPDRNKPDPSKRPATKVSHDARGHAVWQWAAETARNVAITTSQVLRRLDTRSLSLLDDSDSKKTPPMSPATKSHGPVKSQGTEKPGQGFDPYEKRASKPAAKPAARSPARVTKPVRSSWWQRMLRRG